MTGAPLPDRDFVSDAQLRFDALATYQVTLKSTSAGAQTVEVRYGYLKPGFVRMDFIRSHAGATLTYSCASGKATLWSFGFDTFARLDEVLAIGTFEQIDATANIGDIVPTSELDLLFIGPGDLATSMGFKGRGEPHLATRTRP